VSGSASNVVFAGSDLDDEMSLVDLLDNILDQGVVLRGNLVISLAGVDLVYVGLDVILTSVQTALGIGLLLVHDPGVSQVEQFGHRQEIVEAKAVGLLPGVFLLVAAAGYDAVPVAPFAVVSPDRDLQCTNSDFMGWL
jgi:hypothetical protein